MTQVTVRRVEEEWIANANAKAIAAARGVSMNTVFVEVLRKELGGGKPKTNGLEAFIGTNSDGFGEEFEEAMQECSNIDEDSWK